MGLSRLLAEQTIGRIFMLYYHHTKNMTTTTKFNSNGFKPSAKGSSAKGLPSQANASFMPAMDEAVLKAGNELMQAGFSVTVVQTLAAAQPFLLPLVVAAVKEGRIGPEDAKTGIEIIAEEYERTRNKYGALKVSVFAKSKTQEGAAGKTLLVNILNLTGAKVRMNDQEMDAADIFAKLREKNPDMQASIQVSESNVDALSAGRDQHPSAVLESHLLLSSPVVFGIVHRQFPQKFTTKDYYQQTVYIKNGQLVFTEGEEGCELVNKKMFIGKPIYICNTTGKHTPFPSDIEGKDNKPFKVLRLQAAGDFQSFTVSVATETRATLEELLEAAAFAQEDWTKGSDRSRNKRREDRQTALEASLEDDDTSETSELAPVTVA